MGMPSDSHSYSACSVCQQECLCLAPCQPRLKCAAPMPIRWWCVGSPVRTPSHCTAAAASVPLCRNSCRTCGTRTSRRDSRQTGRRRGCRGLWRRLPSVTICRQRGRRLGRLGRRRGSSMRCSPRRLPWTTAAVSRRTGACWWGQAASAIHCFVSIRPVEPACISIDTYVLPQCTPPTLYTLSHAQPSHTHFIVRAFHTFSHTPHTPTPVRRAAGGTGALQRAVGRQHRMAVWLD